MSLLFQVFFHFIIGLLTHSIKQYQQNVAHRKLPAELSDTNMLKSNSNYSFKLLVNNEKKRKLKHVLRGKSYQQAIGFLIVCTALRDNFRNDSLIL